AVAEQREGVRRARRRLGAEAGEVPVGLRGRNHHLHEVRAGALHALAQIDGRAGRHARAAAPDQEVRTDRARRSLCAGRAVRTDESLRTPGPRSTVATGGTHHALRTCGPRLADEPSDTLRPDVALRTRGALRTDGARRTLGAGRAPGTLRALGTNGTLRAD